LIKLIDEFLIAKILDHDNVIKIIKHFAEEISGEFKYFLIMELADTGFDK
jgi:hypothetical protein